MKIQNYFKNKLEDLFLYTKVATKEQYQTILDEHCKGCAKCLEMNENNVVIEFDFECIKLKYDLSIGQGEQFKKIEKIQNISYIEMV
jgi:hypothetical protein